LQKVSHGQQSDKRKKKRDKKNLRSQKKTTKRIKEREIKNRVEKRPWDPKHAEREEQRIKES